MAADQFDPDALIGVAAPLLGLEIAGERRAAVATFLMIAKGMADILEQAPVPPGSLDFAPVFVPGATAGD